MKRLFIIAAPVSLILAGVLPHVALAQEAANNTVNTVEFVGKMIYGPKGERIGAVYKVAHDGGAQVIISGKLVNIPAATLNAADGKLTTSLDKRALTNIR
ncbi:MAG: hypothetical protein NTX28_01525 [Novosphingobium sp.]|nr:hypothetical protein [Novosphingobium sp.]